MQEEGNKNLRDTGKVGFGTVGIHYWRIQETRDTGNDDYRKRGILETRVQDKEEWKQKRCRTGGIQNAGQLGCRTVGMQDSWDAGLEGCRKGGTQDKYDVGE